MKLISFSFLAAAILLSSCASTGQLSDNYEADVPIITLPASKAGIQDYRADYRKAFCDIQASHGDVFLDGTPCDSALHRLQEDSRLRLDHTKQESPSFRQSVHVIVLQGVLGECAGDLAPPLQYARRHLETHGYTTSVAEVSGRSGPLFNAEMIFDHVASNEVDPSKKLVFIGYSKGAVDTLQAMVSYPDLASDTLAVVSLAGPISGSPIADKNAKLYKKFGKKLKLKNCAPGDGEGVESLRTNTRTRWLQDNQLPRSVDYYSLVAFSKKENISRILRSSYSKLAKEDKRNDSNVIISDAIIPGGRLLGYANADHWAVALPFSEKSEFISSTLVNKNSFPREAMLEAMLRVIELSADQNTDYSTTD